MADSVTLTIEVGRRWWFKVAAFAILALTMLGIIRDTERATQWMARNAVWLRYRDGEGAGQISPPRLAESACAEEFHR
jgi:hypothetical protein